MQELGFDPTIDSATKVALMRNDIAHQSVQALIDDLDHVTSNIAANEQADAARAVLAHHAPPVADALLSDAGRRLQRAARAALSDLADGLSILDQPDRPATLVPNQAVTRLSSPPRALPSTTSAVPRSNADRRAAVIQPAAPEPTIARDRWRSIVMTAVLTGGIATGGFTIGALLQRLL